MSADSNTHWLDDCSPERIMHRFDEAICGFDTDWRITFVNNQAATMLERTPDELLGERIWDVAPTINETVVGQQLKEAMSTGTSTRFEQYNEELDRWFKIRIYPDEDGATACFYDITDERGRELDAQRQRQLFETVFEETEDALVVADTDRRITDFNPAAEQLFGYDASDVFGESTRLLYANDDEYDRQGDQRFNEDAPVCEETYLVEYERADGTTFLGETLGTSLKGPDDETLAFLGSIRDVSARIEHEQALEAHNDALRAFHDITTDDSQSVAERTDAVLELGCEYLELDIGILSAIDGNEYTAEQVVAPDEAIRSGELFDLSATFCELVVDSDQLVAETNASRSELADHPAYDVQGLESYIGTPVVVDGERYGTLNFSQPVARQRPFTAGERTVVRIFAQWIGKELSQQRNKRRATANRDRLRQIIDLLPQLVFAKDRDNEYILANQAIADAYGSTVEEVEGSTDAEFVSSEAEAEQFRQDDLAVMDSGEPKHIPEEPLTTADGETLTFQTIKIPYDPVDHDVEAVLGVATDITEMTEQRRQLEETTQRLNVALEGTNTGVWEMDTDTEAVVWTDSMASLVGIDLCSFGGSFEAFASYVHPEDLPAVREAVDHAIETETRFHHEYRITRGDDTHRWVEARADLVDRGDAGRQLVGIATDITDRKQRDAEIEVQAAAMEAAMDGIAILDTDEAFIYMNQAHAEMFGFEREALLDRSWEDLYEPTELKRLYRDVHPVLQESGEWRGEAVARTQSGEPIQQEITLSLLDDGKMIVTTRDISERKQREQTLERQSAAMEVAMDGIAILDSDEYVYMNQAHADIFDYDPEALLGREWRDLYGDEEIEWIKAEVFPELAETGSWRGETVGEKKDGTPVRQDLGLALLDSGELICTNRDITTQKQREEKLQQQRSRIRALFDNSPDGIVIHNADGAVVDVNETIADSLGYDREMLMSMNVAEFEAGITQSELVTIWAEMVPNETLKVEGKHRRQNGETFPVEVWVNKVVVGGNDRYIAVSRDITKRKQREAELRRSREFIEKAQESASIGGWEVDLEADSLRWTDEVYRIHDLPTSADMNVDRAFGFYHPNDESTLTDAFDRLVTNGESYDLEVRIETANDRVRWVRVAGDPQYNDDGEVIKVVGITQEISDRKVREQELKRSREFIEKGQESASIGGWEVDLESDSLRWTDEVYRIHDLPIGTLIEPQDGLDFYHPDDQSTIEAAFDRLVTEGEPYDLELRIVTANGRVRWVRAVGDPQFDADGTIVGAIGVFQDITERREREAELREVKERLDLAVEGANLGVWDWNMESDEVTFNEQWALMLGLSLDEIEPRLETWEDRVHPADMAGVEAALEAHIAGDEALYDCEHRMRTKSGEWRWARDVGKVVDRNDDGTPTRSVGIHLDITDRKEAELRLEEQRDMFAEGPAIVFKWKNDEGWPVEYVSKNIAETFGYTPEQLTSGTAPYADLIHDEDLERVTREVSETSKESTDRVTHDPYRMVTRDGEIRWVTDNTKILRSDGEITHYLGYLIDITEQKRLENSLRESEQSVRELTSIASDTDRGFEAKLTALLELGSQRLELPYGFLNRIDGGTQHVAQAIGDHPQLQTGASAPKSQSYCRKTIEQSTPLAIHDAVAEGWEGDPAYERFDLGCYIGDSITVNGEPYGTLCFADKHSRDHEFDPSERAFVELLVQWASHELSTAAFETKLHEINETAQHLMAVPSNTQIASLAVESTRSILGMPLIGVWWYDENRDALVPEQMTEEATELIPEQPIFERGTALAWEAFDTGDMQVHDDLGAVDGLHNEETPLRSKVIVPLGDYGIMTAGSVEPQAFSETDINLLEVLSSTVEAALTRAERETELRETQAALKQSNEELEQFAYAASHDLQEPLRTVSSYLTLLERRYGDDLDGDATEFIEFAVDGADRMRNMIQALLAYSRVDTRGESFEVVELSDLFEQVTGSLGVKIAETDATVSTPSTAATVRGDPSQLSQLFQNLVDNAITYNTGQPEVDLSVRSHDGQVTVGVTDNGIGIEPDQIDGIFEVFQRLHTRKEFDGTGIGLSICRKIVDRHDGDIDVQSAPGEGSTFTITLPEDGVSNA